MKVTREILIDLLEIKLVRAHGWPSVETMKHSSGRLASEFRMDATTAADAVIELFPALNIQPAAAASI